MILIFDPHGGIRGGVLADRKGDAFPLDDDNLNLPGRILRVNHGHKSAESQQETEPKRERTFA
jgi:hypothetical protein